MRERESETEREKEGERERERETCHRRRKGSRNLSTSDFPFLHCIRSFGLEIEIGAVVLFLFSRKNAISAVEGKRDCARLIVMKQDFTKKKNFEARKRRRK